MKKARNSWNDRISRIPSFVYLPAVLVVAAVLLLASISDLLTNLALPLVGIMVGWLGIYSCRLLGHTAANRSLYVYLLFVSGSTAIGISHLCFPELIVNVREVVNALFIVGASLMTLVQTFGDRDIAHSTSV